MSGLAYLRVRESGPKTSLRKCSVFYPTGSNLVFLAQARDPAKLTVSLS